MTAIWKQYDNDLTANCQQSDSWHNASGSHHLPCFLMTVIRPSFVIIWQPLIQRLSNLQQQTYLMHHRKKTQHWATQWINSVFFQLRNPIIWNPLPFLLILLERPWVADDDEVLVYLKYKENENIFFILNTIESLFLHRYGT